MVSSHPPNPPAAHLFLSPSATSSSPQVLFAPTRSDSERGSDNPRAGHRKANRRSILRAAPAPIPAPHQAGNLAPERR
ncbi:unnamed protein product [Rangifer tarandus platyrhynchus]|uniref:Uncharacterized protein n=1 Tax=Rangifer tarandus platyrhynchus TaxID=3082113 RepID=A0ABN8ZBR2_RANTA|nr:unnamed protein product [Rangifer tarandus platyrhynchus]